MLLLGCSPSQSEMQRFAEDFVKERQVKWNDRIDLAPSIVVGSKEEDVIGIVGKPDAESNSATTKNWLYWIDPNIKGDQVWVDSLILEIEGGVVVNRKQGAGLRQGFEDFYRSKHR